ncbi:MAG: ABC transporter ATP-binding protein [Rhodospirillales bacterium]|nr:ABC transporter ATP-binding protein [Alphaproteobacteria bacterium]MCB1839077.1 ABC transporter ATP-binding protein [Alphaproteobacteria bacterium]MCB9977121.1 ABC transporter ATP-binding protein [Rhodospirillales bacterium]
MVDAVTLQNIVKDFPVGDRRSIRVIHDVSCAVRMGELTMLVGPSGCGKTTLISIMSGILTPTGGSVDVMGQDLTRLSDRKKVIFRREHIGFIFQQFNLLPALTAAENAAMPLIAGGIPVSDARKKGAALLETLGMGEHLEKLPRQLSGGQQQRVAIARALVHEPKLIVCDEPTASLDAKTGQSVMDILRTAANDQKRAVLVVTHDNRIYHFADRILEMSDGQITGEHKPEDYVHKE